MSATYEAAVRDLDDAATIGGQLGQAERSIASQVGIGWAVLALAEEVEALVELLRERLPDPGPCGHSLGTQCLGCDHAVHRGAPCVARAIGARGEGPCGCRFDAELVETAPRQADGGDR